MPTPLLSSLLLTLLPVTKSRLNLQSPRFLAFLWFILCASLVCKHRPLLLVFVSFSSCFILAAVILYVMNITTTTTTTTTDTKKKQQKSALERKRKQQLEQIYRLEEYFQAGNLVGLLVLGVVAAFLLLHSNQERSYLISPEYVSLSIVAGYLAFEHWWSAVYCQNLNHHRSLPAPLLALTTKSKALNSSSIWYYFWVLHDALFLSVILVALVLYQHQLQAFRLHILTWLCYKLARFVATCKIFDQIYTLLFKPSLSTTTTTTTNNDSGVNLKNEIIKTNFAQSVGGHLLMFYKTTVRLSKIILRRPSNSQRKNINTTTNTTASIPNNKNVNIDEDTAQITTNNKNLPLPTSADLWIIHGQAYDLRLYVDKHPGGTESILLGQGRHDCTALFESYHPFVQNQRHLHILEKYKVKVDDKTTSNNCISSNITTTNYNDSCANSKTTTVVDDFAHGQACVTDDDKRIDSRINSGTTIASRLNTSTPKDQFYQILCTRAAQALREQGIDPIRDRVATWSRIMYYSVVIAAVLISLYAHVKGSIMGSFTLAVTGWWLGALGHDAGHFAVSRKAWVNNVCVWGMSFLCNPVMWQHQHTYAHHSFTNDHDHDPDLHHFTALLRVHKRFKHNSYILYKLQAKWLYVVFAYSFVTFGTCFWIPQYMIQTNFLYDMVEYTDRKRPWKRFGMLAHLITYFGLVVIWPFVKGGFWHWRAYLAVWLHLATSGLIFAFFSQINHINEDSFRNSNNDKQVSDSTVSEDNTAQTRETAEEHKNVKNSNENDHCTLDLLKNSWAVQQIEYSNNFCPNNPLWHFLANGLNLQIEHHLFPGINHCHLHHLVPVVEETCAEYGVSYKTYDSWTTIFQSTLHWLETLSVDKQM